ncbi:UNVERIFIED_CONTAM: hypothetical protein Sradi_5728500 [Sesamum radiatum]|uniref:Copia protein n=1 Tax=Sesamum radiatum TaxID=300843 RepID=A0AAW2L218_SESRA
MLTYRRKDQLEIIGYTDSNFVGFQDRMKSTLGYMYMFAEEAISWKSAKQSLRASSTVAAEFVASYEVSNHEIWLQNFSMGLHIVDTIDRPLKLFCDNKSAVLYSNNKQELNEVEAYRHEVPSCERKHTE